MDVRVVIPNSCLVTNFLLIIQHDSCNYGYYEIALYILSNFLSLLFPFLAVMSFDTWTMAYYLYG